MSKKSFTIDSFFKPTEAKKFVTDAPKVIECRFCVEKFASSQGLGNHVQGRSASGTNSSPPGPVKKKNYMPRRWAGRGGGGGGGGRGEWGPRGGEGRGGEAWEDPEGEMGNGVER